MRDGHVVETAADGREALVKFLAADFDLVLTDSAMPVMRGEDLAVEVKRARPGQRVAMLTGFGDVMRATGQRPPGVDLVLAKPASLDDLRRALVVLIGT